MTRTPQIHENASFLAVSYEYSHNDSRIGLDYTVYIQGTNG